jgi:hypothetical protein
MLVFALALAEPIGLTELQQRDIGCVALLGLLAEEQRIKASYEEFPNVKSKGRTYAGIVGARIVEQSGLPREVIAQAIIAAAQNAAAQSNATMQAKAEVRRQLTQCLLLMDAELLANAPLPKPVKSQ